MNEDVNAVQVQMLGKFELKYQGKVVDLRFGTSTKVMQILQILLCQSPRSVPTTTLLQYLFEYDEILNPRNNLKVSISQLRRRLNESELPGTQFVMFQNGSYNWNPNVPVELDVREFERLVKAGVAAKTEDEQVQMYRQALELYQGDFIPELEGVDWATKLNTYYWNVCSDVVRSLTKVLMSRQDYSAAFALLDRTFKQHPAEEWQILKIECAMQQQQWDLAKDIYEETVAILNREFAVPPSQTLLEQYETISKKTQHAFSSMDSVMENVREHQPVGGAYYCAFPGFIDACRIISRNMARSGISCYIMMCYLADRNGKTVTNSERLSQASGRLFESIQSSLRRGDAFTQYNNCQFLIFLFGASRENCGIVFDRIRKAYGVDPIRGVQVYSQITSCALDLEQDINIGECGYWTSIEKPENAEN